MTLGGFSGDDILPPPLLFSEVGHSEVTAPWRHYLLTLSFSVCSALVLGSGPRWLVGGLQPQ